MLNYKNVNVLKIVKILSTLNLIYNVCELKTISDIFWKTYRKIYSQIIYLGYFVNSANMMILGLRSRDGMERILVDSKATIQQLKEAITTQTHISKDKQYLSINREILLSQGCDILHMDMMYENVKLCSLGIAHGDVIYLYHQCGERNISKKYNTFDLNGGSEIIEELAQISLKRSRKEIPFEDYIERPWKKRL